MSTVQDSPNGHWKGSEKQMVDKRDRLVKAVYVSFPEKNAVTLQGPGRQLRTRRHFDAERQSDELRVYCRV